MKIILEHKYGRVVIEDYEYNEDGNIYDFKEKMLEPLLLAMTYSPSTIKELFNEEE